jgi:hypothetical protein
MAGKHENEKKIKNLGGKKIKIFIHTKLNLFLKPTEFNFGIV